MADVLADDWLRADQLQDSGHINPPVGMRPLWEPDAFELLMRQTIEVSAPQAIPVEYRNSPVGELLEYHNLDRPLVPYSSAELLIGMCMDHRVALRLPENFAYVIRSPGANLRPVEFAIAYAIAVGGVRAIAIIAHTDCGMAGLAAKQSAFVEGLVQHAGWENDAAEEHFVHSAPAFDIGEELDFTLGEAQRLRTRFPRIRVAPLVYRVEDKRLSLIREA